MHLCSINIAQSYIKERKKERKKERQKIDDLLVLATCLSGTLAMLYSKVNVPVTHGSTR